MDIRCPSCSKLFRVADEKIAGKGIRFKCSKCAEVITITKDDFEMDLLARDAAAAEAAPPPPPPPPAAQPAPVVPPPTPAATAPAAAQEPESEAREYKPAQEQPADDQTIPPASLGDFDFSEPHAAASAAAHPDDGFGSGGLSFEAEAEQGAAPEIEISPEAAAEAEAALQFPDDLISEPKRKPAFGSASPEAPAPDSASDTGGTDEDVDLGAALAMPKVPVLDDETAALDNEPDAGPPPTAPKGPVISPELLAQMKRNAQERSKMEARTTSSAGDEIDLGAALAMPKTKDAEIRGAAKSVTGSAVASQVGEATSSRKPLLIGGVIALVLVAAVAALYSLGYLGGKSEQGVQQPATQPQTGGKLITHDGLSIIDPAAYVEPERGDIVITGKILNALDKPKAGWFLVTEVRDAKEAVLATVTMVNGAQVLTERDRELLAKRGMKPEQIRNMSASKDGRIPAGGSVSFEVRVLGPPAGSARFLPMLRTFDPAILVQNQ